MTKRLLLAIMFCTSGCATSAFKVPAWNYQNNITTPQTVEAYLTSHIAVYDQLLSQVEAGKAFLEIPIIPAAIVGTTGVALGASTDLPIALGGGAAGLAAGSSYLNPRERLGKIIQARAATVCIRREYVEQVQLLRALNLLAPAAVGGAAPVRVEIGASGAVLTTSSTGVTEGTVAAVVMNEIGLAASRGQQPLVPTLGADSLPLIADQIGGVGSIAVAAEDEVVTRLKAQLAALGTAPNYSAIVTDLRQRFEQAQAKADATTGGGSSPKIAGSSGTAVNVLIKTIAEYSARIAECTAKIPA